MLQMGVGFQWESGRRDNYLVEEMGLDGPAVAAVLGIGRVCLVWFVWLVSE
jgi:hypothetical protein